MDDIYSNDYFFVKELQTLVEDVEWELFNIDTYIKSLEYPDNDLIFLLGTSGEGKSVFAIQFILKLLEKNIKHNLKTSLWVLSETNDSKKMLVNCAHILKNLFPALKETWNDGIVTIAHTKKFADIVNDFEMLKSKKEEEIKNLQFIFYLDDVGTILSCKEKEKRSFFDSLASQGRHYNIVTIINSQKVNGLAKTLLSQIGTSIIVGKINYNDWELLMKNGTFHSLSKKTQQELYEKYFTQIGVKGSRNILIFQKKEQKKVFLQKVSEKFVNLIKKLEY